MKLLVFRENDSRRLSDILQMHCFWNFDHISRIYNKINSMNNWFSESSDISYPDNTSAFSKVFFTLMPLSSNSPFLFDILHRG